MKKTLALLVLGLFLVSMLPLALAENDNGNKNTNNVFEIQFDRNPFSKF